jgi:multiple sugar transport system permease protein
MATMQREQARTRPDHGWLAPVRRVIHHRRYNEWIWAYVFLSPAIAVFLAFLLYPAIQSLIYSFQSFDALKMDRPWVGFDNYAYLFGDPVWWTAVRNTILFTLLTVPFTVGMALLIAILLMPINRRLQTLFKTVFYMPGVTSAIVIGLVWLWVLYPFNEGLANYLLGAVGIGRVNWLGTTSTALPSIVVMSWMTGQGAAIVLYMAALGNIPSSLYEAADIDCATGWTRFRRITWPLIKPTTLYAAITATVGSFLIFDLVYALTKGGPGTSTVTVVFRVFQIGFERLQFGLASAGAVILALIAITFNFIQFRFLSTDVEY